MPLHQTDNTPPIASKSPLQQYGPLAILLVAIALIYAMGWHKYLSFQSLAQNKDWLVGHVNEHYVLSLFIYAMAYILVVALSLPVASFLTLFGGLLFGAFIAGPLTIVSATIGAAIIFLVAKTSFGDTLAAKAGPLVGKMRDGFKDHALNYLLFLRLVPLFPFWLVNIAPALLGVRLSTFTLGTLLGIIPGTMAYSFVGEGLGSVIDAQKNAFEQCIQANGGHEAGCSLSLDTSNLLTPELLLAFAALGIVALIPVILQKFRHKKDVQS